MKQCRVPGHLFEDGKWSEISKIIDDAGIDIQNCHLTWDFDTGDMIYKQLEGE